MIDSLGRFGRREASEEEVIAAFMQRVTLTQHETAALERAGGPRARQQEEFRIVIRRMRLALKDAQISVEDLLRHHRGPVPAILLLRYFEGREDEPTTVLAARIEELGFRAVQNDLWILPPARMPHSLRTERELQAWVDEQITTKLGKEVQYSIPLVALINMKRVIAAGSKKWGRHSKVTVFASIDPDEILLPSVVYSLLRRKNLGIKRVLRSGDIGFLCSSFSDDVLVSKLEASRHRISRRLAEVSGKERIDLRGLSQMDEKSLIGALQGLIPLPKGVAQRLIAEARYWESFLNGEAPGEPEPRRAGIR